MRLNQYIAQATGLSRRKADTAIADNRVKINGQTAKTGQTTTPADQITLDGQILSPPDQPTTIILNKPVGYVCSRDGQGSKTIYDLLPEKYRHLKPIGRLDKDSSGLLLLTNNGRLAHQLTHPSFQKQKVYEVRLAEGKNRQIRRTFEALGYKVTKLHRTHFGPHSLNSLASSQWETVV